MMHKYIEERCIWCGLGQYQMFTDEEDDINLAYCLVRRLKVMPAKDLVIKVMGS